MEKNKKVSASIPAPAQTHTSKAAKKNAKRKEKKKQQQQEHAVNLNISEVAKAVNKVEISSPPATDCESKTDLVKKLKNLKKKLKKIEELEMKINSGELKNPEKDQLEKVSRKASVINEIEDLEIELEDSS